MFEQIKKIRNNFLNNLETLNSFNVSRDILKEFRNIVNHKTLIGNIFLVSLYSSTVQGIELDAEALKSKILSSTVENIEYKKNNFLTITENNINSLKNLDKTKVENPFFKKNIVLITKNKEYFGLNKNQHAALSTGSAYKINKLEDQKNNISNGIDKYKHVVYINDLQFEVFQRNFKIENKNHVYSLFLLHELAHSSFEQGSFTSVNPNFRKFGQIQIEIHSDISAILMYSKFKNFNSSETISLIDDLITFRLNNTIYNNDWKHDSTLSLLELKNKLENEDLKINELDKEDISPYAAQLTTETFNKNYDKELKNIFDKERMPYKKSAIFASLLTIKDSLNKNKSLNRQEKYFEELSSVIIKKDIAKLEDSELLTVATKIESQFNNVTPTLLTYFSKYYQDGYKDILRLNKKNNFNIALKI